MARQHVIALLPEDTRHAGALIAALNARKELNYIKLGQDDCMVFEFAYGLIEGTVDIYVDSSGTIPATMLMTLRSYVAGGIAVLRAVCDRAVITPNVVSDGG